MDGSGTLASCAEPMVGSVADACPAESVNGETSVEDGSESLSFASHTIA